VAPKSQQTIKQHFANLKDPRTGNAQRHDLLDILVIAICATICGADGWTDVEQWGQANELWLRTFLSLPQGIPSHDTFGRVFALIDPQAFRECFLSWVRAISQLTQRTTLSVDGKKVRRSHDRRHDQDAIHMVSVWAEAQQLVLAQTKISAKSNEITAIPALLRLLDLSGCIVTIDAIGCQTTIAQTIVQQGGDYLLAAKENQKRLHQDLQDLFSDPHRTNLSDATHGYIRTVDKGHGRVEIRECWTVSDPTVLAYLSARQAWPHLHAAVLVRAERRLARQTSVEQRYYISSLENDARLILQTVRGHWGIENRLHWVLDIAFREDECRVRKDHAPENLAVIRHMALNLLRSETSLKLGVKAKRLRAAWDRSYLLKVLSS
jgi:predicted transposase YbfD/YdcC